MPDTLAAQVASITQAMIEVSARLMPQMAPIAGLSEKVNINAGNNSALFPRVNSTFTVQTPTEGDDIVQSSQFSLTSTTISPTLRVVKVRISERAKYFSKEDIIKLCSEELSRVHGQDLDTDLSAEFANFAAGNDTGTTNTDITLAVLRTSRRLLQANTVANGGPAPDPIATVLAPIVVENLLTNMGVQGAVASTNPYIPEGLSQQLIKQYLVPGINLVGVPVFWDGYMTEDGSADYICAMFSKRALQYAISKDWDMRTFEESEFVGVILRTVADYNSGVGKFSGHGSTITADGA